VAVDDPQRYQHIICERHGLPPQSSAGLTTAANMNNAAISDYVFEDLHVVAAATGGVETNAARAGDPASYYHRSGTTIKIPETHGTINVIAAINMELTPGAMVQAVITATEAKAALMQELGIPSRYSDGHATGTGTDQIGVASMLCENKITDAGKHSKVGELIGKAVHDSIRDTLKLQNGLYPEGQCSVFRHIERLGVRLDDMRKRITEMLDDRLAELFQKNFMSIDRDPPTVAATAALVHIRDKCVWGIFPESCFAELILPYAIQIAVAVSGKCALRNRFEERLSEREKSLRNDDVVDILFRAIAVGFEEKWK
jgi:adenosylcobinamide amidohydrolase